jgi:23S rRNA pseudouridine1911/1915/1917 synthase
LLYSGFREISLSLGFASSFLPNWLRPSNRVKMATKRSSCPEKSMNPKKYRFIPGPQDSGMRLDQFVAGQTGDFSRTFLRRVVEIGGVHVGGKRVRRCSHPVRAGDAVEIFLDGRELEVFTLTPPDVVFQDKFLLAVAKPPGVETQPTPSRYKGTLYEALLRYLQDPFRPLDRPPLGMVQRLDRDTSGVMVFSIHGLAHRGLTQAFSGRSVGKVYLALVRGRLPGGTGEIRSLLARSRSSNRMHSVDRGGKEAITRYRVVEEFAEGSLVEVEIPTGRSHQIRVHLAEAGHPLLGDGRYGGPASAAGRDIPRQMLHAAKLFLVHPVSGEPLVLEAPLPEDMREILEVLRNS